MSVIPLETNLNNDRSDKKTENINESITDKHWSVTNTNTLLKWITIGSHYIKVLEQTIAFNRTVIRLNTIISIILTTATGSIGVSQISSIFSTQHQLVLTLIFTVMSFFLTISTGVIKVLLIHENLEKCIQVKQEWTSFITNISTELQLPRDERQDAVKLIRDNKMIYLSLLNKDIELNAISEKIAKKHIQFEINNSKIELEIDAQNNELRKDGRNNYIIDFGFSRKMALHNDYSKMMNSVGISISDITNHIVKTELQAIVDVDLEAQYKKVVKTETEIAKVKFSCELQHKQKEMETKRLDKSSSMLMLMPPSSPITSDIGEKSKPSFKNDESITFHKEKASTKQSSIDEHDTENDSTFSWRKILHL